MGFIGMSVVGTVESVWRYPVKSMRGDMPDAAFVGFSGVYGDRIFAFKSSAGVPGFPYLTGREQREMLLYQPKFRDPLNASLPPNLTAAEDLSPGLTCVYARHDDLMLDVVTPAGDALAVDDPALIDRLSSGLDEGDALTLLQSHRSMTDCRPVSLISLQTVDRLSRECGVPVDKRQFRANVYLDLADAEGFTEDKFVGRTLGIGPRVRLSILERDPRCAMITLDPDTAKSNPTALRYVTRSRDGMAGIYAAVLVEGVIRTGDEVKLIG